MDTSWSIDPDWVIRPTRYTRLWRFFDLANFARDEIREGRGK